MNPPELVTAKNVVFCLWMPWKCHNHFGSQASKPFAMTFWTSVEHHEMNMVQWKSYKISESQCQLSGCLCWSCIGQESGFRLGIHCYCGNVKCFHPLHPNLSHLHYLHSYAEVQSHSLSYKAMGFVTVTVTTSCWPGRLTKCPIQSSCDQLHILYTHSARDCNKSTEWKPV